MPNKHIFQDESIQGVVTKRSHQDISYTKLMTMDMGIIYPAVCDEMIPGDIVDISQSLNIKFQPLVTPVFSRLKVRSDYFFVPNRIVWDKWETFITRGKSGDEIIPMITIKDRLDSLSGSETWTKEAARQFTGLGSLYESFGLPVQAEDSGTNIGIMNLDMLNGMKREDILPLDMPFRSYYRIWNEYYRDEDLQDEVDELTSYELMRISWSKDYFTTARPWQQKGTTPIMPVTATVAQQYFNVVINAGSPSSPDYRFVQFDQSSNSVSLSNPKYTGDAKVGSGTKTLKTDIDLNLTGLGFTISDLRLCVQLQRWMELNARAGSSRYTEFLRAQYGTYPSDERLDRPEYIGGFTDFITISEVLQTSETTATSPQANRAATANGISQGYIGRYRVEEHGWLICMTSITPLPEYQNQMSKQWTRRSTFDYYFPLFANISEQPVRNYEVFTGVFSKAEDDDPNYRYNNVFGFQAPWNEYRTKDNQITGRFRSPSYDGGLLPQSDSVDLVASIDYWHTARRFDSSAPPSLNGAFIEARPPRDFIAVLTEPAMLVRIDNNIQAFRPLPEFGTPGRLDHFM